MITTILEQNIIFVHSPLLHSNEYHILFSLFACTFGAPIRRYFEWHSATELAIVTKQQITKRAASGGRGDVWKSVDGSDDKSHHNKCESRRKNTRFHFKHNCKYFAFAKYTSESRDPERRRRRGAGERGVKCDRGSSWHRQQNAALSRSGSRADARTKSRQSERKLSES